MTCFSRDQDIEISLSAAIALSKRMRCSVAIMPDLSVKPIAECTLRDVKCALEIIKVKGEIL
jgi:hypothetical protein